MSKNKNDFSGFYFLYPTFCILLFYFCVLLFSISIFEHSASEWKIEITVMQKFHFFSPNQ